MLSNPVVISIVVLLALSLLRVNVVIALVISALTAGLCGDLGLSKTIEAFTGGLGGGAEVAMNYAMLGAFAIAISKSGITDLLAYKIITRMNKTPTGKNLAWFKYATWYFAFILNFIPKLAPSTHCVYSDCGTAFTFYF